MIIATNDIPQATNSQRAMIEGLLHTSTLEQWQQEDIEMELPGMTEDRAQEVINNLMMNQQETDNERLKRQQRR